MTIPKARRDDIVRLGTELRLRGFSVYEHPNFGGVTPRWHIPGSKHLDGRALDAGRDPRPGAPISHHERIAFDALAPELDRRRFGVIWWRTAPGKPQDHRDHLHAETRESDAQQYPGRYSNSGAARKPTAAGVDIHGRAVGEIGGKLVEDGKLGRLTIARIQLWLGTPVDGELWEVSRAVRALQAFLNTEQRGSLTLDGKLGQRTISQLQRYLGTPVDGELWRPSKAVREIQRRLNTRGHLS